MRRGNGADYLHGITTQMITIENFTAMRISNLTHSPQAYLLIK